MATNKFATMLERNTNRITVILVYAVLEWILIILLLLNSLFSYLITKFADYFGLKPPCSWCSRIDHIMNPANNSNSYRSNMCEAHASEISRLGYCSNHRRLAESEAMCSDCLASVPGSKNERIAAAAAATTTTTRIGFISWVSTDMLENGQKAHRCSCCNDSMSSDLYPPYWLFKPSWGATLKYTGKGSLIIEAIDDESNGSECRELSKPESLSPYGEESTEIEGNGEEDQNSNEVGEENEHQMPTENGSLSITDASEEKSSAAGLNSEHDLKEADEDQAAANHDATLLHRSCDETAISRGDNSIEIINYGRHLALELSRTIPLELIDSSTMGSHGSCNTKTGSSERLDHENETSDYAEFDSQGPALGEIALHIVDNQVKISSEEVELAMAYDEKLQVIDVEEMMEDLVEEACKQVISLQVARALSVGASEIVGEELKESDDLSAKEQETNDVTLSASTGFTELSHCATIGPQEQIPPLPSQIEDPSFAICNGAEIPGTPDTCIPQEELGVPGPKLEEEKTAKSQSTSADKIEEEKNHHLALRSDPNEADEEKLPETPTSVDSVHNLHKKLLLDKRECGTEESIDGSVVSENESGDPVLTIERLKTALKAERKALSTLYTELEEERSASAIAANQTMAMINRLQEEKAALQMEASQYQRMMEEQSEYDQEALQLLNELMMKREKEKQELEKELEVYRKKVSDYETKEKMRIMRSIRSRSSSATCSNGEDSDDISIDLNREAKDDVGSTHGKEGSNTNTSGDEVTNLQEIALDCVKQMTALDDSLAEFEEERLSILDQLKALEEKLIKLNHNDSIEDEHSSRYSVKELDENYELNTPEGDGISNELPTEKCYPERKTMGTMAKSLLPLLDAVDDDTERFILEENSASEAFNKENSPISNFELYNKKIAIEEEVDHVYERLQALEADREFLRHCMSSIQKGDKGMDLLQEILQHLRDLRAVELRTREMNDDTLQPMCTD